MIDMIYISRKASNKEEANLILSRKNDGININMIIGGDTFGYSFCFGDIDYSPEIVHLGFSISKGIYQFTGAECRESRSGLAFILETNSAHCINSMSNIGALWVPKNKDEGISAFFNGHCNVWLDGVNDSEYKVIENYYSSNKVFNDFIPESRDYFKRSDAKRNLLKKINELDSLAMIEAQLDLLTRYVLSGIGKEQLENAVKDRMVTTIHDDNKLVQTIQRQKDYLRKIQKEYLVERGNFENGNISS